VSTPRELSLAVLYAADRQEYENGYDLVRRIHPEVCTQLQDDRRSLKTQIQELIAADHREFFTFFVDDNVVIRPFGWLDREFDILRQRRDVASLSLRLSPNVRYCQPLNMQAPAPNLDVDRTWDWRAPRTRLIRVLKGLTGKSYAKGDWAGSMFMDGYVFRYQPFVEYFSTLPDIGYVTKLESIMLGRPLPGHRVVCYSQSRIINVVLNRVDTHSGYPHPGGSVAELNSRFLAGQRMAYAHLVNIENRACHLTLEPRWQTA